MKYTFKNVMILGLGCLLGFTSCSDSWLNTDSTQTAEGDVIFSSTDNAKLVIAICQDNGSATCLLWTKLRRQRYYEVALWRISRSGFQLPLYGTGMVSADEQPVYYNLEQQFYL